MAKARKMKNSVSKTVFQKTAKKTNSMNLTLTAHQQRGGLRLT